MAYLLMTYFGQQGRREAQKLLERNAQDGDRLLGAFNRPMPHWLDFFCYTMFVDRDGKFQLGMLSTSAFKPLAASMGPMLKEESFHLGTGSNGLRRIIKAGVIPLDMLQRYINKWVSTAHDLFGVDASSSAHWAYVWGIKGRWDERKKLDAGIEVNKEVLNEESRGHYHEEIVGETENEFCFNFKVENIKVLPGTYDVVVSQKLLSRFTSKNHDLIYYIALEPDSTFG